MVQRPVVLPDYPPPPRLLLPGVSSVTRNEDFAKKPQMETAGPFLGAPRFIVNGWRSEHNRVEVSSLPHELALGDTAEEHMPGDRADRRFSGAAQVPAENAGEGNPAANVLLPRPVFQREDTAAGRKAFCLLHKRGCGPSCGEAWEEALLQGCGGSVHAERMHARGAQQVQPEH